MTASITGRSDARVIPTRSRECSCAMSMVRASVLTWEADDDSREDGNWDFVGLGSGWDEADRTSAAATVDGDGVGDRDKDGGGC